MTRIITGALVLVPVYLAILLLLKAVKSLGVLLVPIAALLPASLPAVELLAVALMIVLCFIAGALVQTVSGDSVRQWLERSVLERIPGYSLLRSLARQVAGTAQESAWQPALVEIEEALVPAFIIETLPDGRYTVFVSSVPSPLAGAVYILEASRVHPVDVPFTQAIKVCSHWGEGAKDLVAAMRRDPSKNAATVARSDEPDSQ